MTYAHLNVYDKDKSKLLMAAVCWIKICPIRHFLYSLIIHDDGIAEARPPGRVVLSYIYSFRGFRGNS